MRPRSRSLLLVLPALLGWAPRALAAQLSAPTSLAATSQPATSIRLAWVGNNKSPAEDGFIIERSLSATTGFVTVGTAAKDATSYVDAGLTWGVVYYYRVATKRTSQLSSYSNVANATAQDLTAP